MTKRLKDGEQREIKASKQFHVCNGRASFANTRIKVVAHREDCDTPYVRINIGMVACVLTDTETRDLIDRLTRALDVLPTSK